MSDEGQAPGWDAIDAALEPLYGGQRPRHWAAVSHRATGGSHPLDGVSAYGVPDPPHWHAVVRLVDSHCHIANPDEKR